MYGRGPADCEARAQKVSTLLLLPAGSAAASRHSWRALLTTERGGRGLRTSGAGFILTYDNRVTFFKVSGDNLGHPAVGETGANKAGFNLFVCG